ncbi:MAG: hypothetical protein AAGC57_18210 [Pseudomonadota bacterium]
MKEVFLTLWSLPARVLAELRLWSEIHRRRRDLIPTDRRMLADMGIDPAVLDAEALRPVWHISAAERAALLAERSRARTVYAAPASISA